MKRPEKITLLTKLLQSGASHANRQRLQQIIENAPRSLILIDDLDCEKGQPTTDDDPVHFWDKGVEHRMTLRESHNYAQHYGIRTLIVLPAKREV